MIWRVRLIPHRGNRELVSFRPDAGALGVLRDCFARYRERGWEYLDVALSSPSRRRTLDQNALHWALVTIMSQEQDGTDALKDAIHEAQLARYATIKRTPDGQPMQVPEVWPDGRPMLDSDGEPRWHVVRKRSSEMTTVEMAWLIEGDFRELAENGVSMENAQGIANYWIEWATWRWKAKADPILYESVEEYRHGQTWCEACVLRPSAHYAYIGTGGMAMKGETTPADGLMLCAECHRAQHQHGWSEMLREYPHLAGKVNRSRERQGEKKA